MVRLPGAPRVLPAVIAAAVLAAVYGVAAHVRPVAVGTTQRTVTVRAAAVSTIVRACPSPGDLASSGVAVVAAPATSGSGQALVSRLSSRADPPLLTMTRPGQLSVTRVSVAGGRPGPASRPSGGAAIVTQTVPGGVVIRASGSLARGLEAEQFTAGAVPSVRCPSPGTDFWFAGPGQQGGLTIRLVLMNASSRAADASVDILTDAGPLQGSTDTGIPVPPHSMVVQSLSTVLHSSRAVALHVTTSVGQVAAAVEETKGSARGGAWLPVAGTPATRVVLPGLPGTSGTRQLFVAVPGSQNAQIHLTAITTRGSYEPTGGSGLDIPGGSAVEIALPSLAGIPAAIKISSSVPVTASAMAPGGAPGAPGVFTAASGALLEQGVAADNPDRAGVTAQLVLSAPGRAVSAQISTIGQAGAVPGGPKLVQVKAGHSLVVALTKRRRTGGSAFAVVVTPLAGSGPLYAGRVIEGGGAGAGLQALLPVVSALTTVPLPPVRQTFSTARG